MSYTINKKEIEVSSKLICFAFLIMLTQSIFASNIDFDRVYSIDNDYSEYPKIVSSNSNDSLTTACFQSSSEEINNKKDFGGGCYTEELPPESVQKIWDRLLVNGFSVDSIQSDQPEKKEREKLENSDVLLTSEGTQADDTVIKAEMPNQVIDPIEVPSLLGQSCSGPFSYGINLSQTLRVGRCEGDPETTPCYLTDPGIFRQNGNYGFGKEMVSVGKDMLDMLGIKKTKIESGQDINSEEDITISEDLGMFSEMSAAELKYFRENMQVDENHPLDIEKMNVIMDKSIQNSFKSESFSASMQTTCNSNNCRINVYSLFDKMFNQYFSLDLVAFSVGPVLTGFTPTIFKGIGKVVETPYSKLTGKTFKEGSFAHNVFKKGEDPFKAASHAFKFARSKKNIDGFVEKMSVDSANLQKLAQQYNLEKEVNEYYSKLGDKDAIQKFKLEAFRKDGIYGSLSKGQKRVLSEVIYKQEEYMRYTNSIVQEITNDTIYKQASAKWRAGVAKGLAPGDIKKTMTKEEVDSLFNAGETMQKLAKSTSDFTWGSWDWYKGVDKLPTVTERTTFITEDGMIISNTVSSTDVAGKIGSIGDKSMGGKDSFTFIKDGEVYTTKSAKNNLVQNVTVQETLADGTVITTKKIVPQVFEVSSVPKLSKLDKGTLSSYISTANPTEYIGYTDPLTNTYVKKPISSINLASLDPSIYSFDVYTANIKTLNPMNEIDKEIIRKYGYDPIELAADYSNYAAGKQLKDAYETTEAIYNVMKNQGYTTGEALSEMEKVMGQQKIEKYTSYPLNIISNSLEAYLWHWGYWEFKTAGATVFGYDSEMTQKYSMYRIPREFTSLNISPGENGDIYNDAYIDYFANDGSNEGDLFSQYFNSIVMLMAWSIKQGLSAIDLKAVESVSDFLNNLTESHIRRSFVDDIALYTDSMNTGCTQGCSVRISNASAIDDKTYAKSVEGTTPPQTPLSNINKSSDSTGSSTQISNSNATAQPIQSSSANSSSKQSNQVTSTSTEFDITIQISADKVTPNYVIENTSKKNLEDEGQTLITFSHHTDYQGSINKDAAEPVSLVKAINNDETCSAKLDNLKILGIFIGDVQKPYRAALGLSAISHVSYALFTTALHRSASAIIMGDVLPQLVITPELHNCVDDKEGYYAHIFVNTKKEEERIEKSAKNQVADAIEKGADNLEEGLSKMTEGTALQEKAQNTFEDIKQFVDTKMKENPIVQSRFTLIGTTTGNLHGKLFFFELGQGTVCRANALIDEGKEYLVDNKTGQSLIVDKDNGELILLDSNGNKEILIDSDHQDFVKLMAKNLNIPAEIIPHSLSYIPVPDDNSPLFTIDVFGNLTVENQSVLNCLQNNYEAQTGLEMTGDVLTSYLGAVKSANILNAATQYDAIPQGSLGDNSIIAEGVPREIAQGSNAKLLIMGNRSSNLSPVDGKEINLGKNIAIQFTNGQMIYDGEKNAYILWVSETATVNQVDVKDMAAKVSNFTNPITGCEEIGINFKLTPNSEPGVYKSETDQKVETFNTALEKVGPFQMLDTPTKTFIFYTTEPPECQQRLKIIDKETGEVLLDQPITSVTPTEKGMIVTTADGKTHNFEFSAEDGAPKLTYNGTTEPLLSAQGKNGSFWYDPNTGNWYTENGHMIPLNPQYKDGITFQADDTGKVVGTPAINIMNTTSKGGSDGGGGFQIPLTPEKVLPMVLYVLVILFGVLVMYEKVNKKKLITKHKKKI